MDTNNLSIPTYKGIILEAEKFNRDLTDYLYLNFDLKVESTKNHK